VVGILDKKENQVSSTGTSLISAQFSKNKRTNRLRRGGWGHGRPPRELYRAGVVLGKVVPVVGKVGKEDDGRARFWQKRGSVGLP